MRSSTVAKSAQLRSWILDLSILSILFMLFYHILLGHYPLLTPDEARYSEISQEMWRHHNYVTPLVNGIPFLDKPPLFYWLQTFCVKLFGLNEAALRTWPTIAGTLGGILSYCAGRQLFNRRTGWLTAGILGTCMFYFAMSHYANMDLSVALWISAALYCYYFATYGKDQPHAGLLYLGYTFSALGILTKGLIGLALPMLVIFVYLIATGNLRQLVKLRIPSGLLLIVCITSPWFYLVAKANPGFWHYYFIVQQWQRFISHSFNDKQPVYFYLGVVCLGFIPWLFHMLAGVFHFAKSKTQALPHRVFLLSFAGCILVFFSIPASKLVGYILPIFFPLSLMTAATIDDSWRQKQPLTYLRIANMAICLLSLGIAATLLILSFVSNSTTLLAMSEVLWIFFGLFILAGLMLLLSYVQRSCIHVIITLAILAMSMDLTIVYAMSYYFNMLHIQSTLPLTNTLDIYLKPHDHVFSFTDYYQDIPTYLHRPVTLVYNIHNPNIMKHDFWAREFAIGMTQKKYQKYVVNANTFVKTWSSTQRSFAYIHTPLLTYLSHNLNLQYCNLDHYEVVTLIANPVVCQHIGLALSN